MKIFILFLITSLTLSAIIGFGIGNGNIKITKCSDNPRVCMSAEGLKCEDAGGLYMEGGFGSANCVFPPKK